jgi:hypothetical protein
MIRDLEYPADAERVIEGLHAGLRYDAALAVLGNAAAKVPLTGIGPDLSVGVRYGGRDEDEAVRREAPVLLSRFAVISMVSRLDVQAQNLLLQRRVLEHLGTTGNRMTSDAMWGILIRVQRESRDGPVAICSRLVVEHPSPGLQARMKWLDGICRIRNCLAHRLGIVQMVDVKPTGQSLRDVKDSDTLRVAWLRLRVSGGHGEISTFPYTKEHQESIQASFIEEEREWKVGEHIVITPGDCQAIALSLSLVGNHLLADFKNEMSRKLGIK